MGVTSLILAILGAVFILPLSNSSDTKDENKCSTIDNKVSRKEIIYRKFDNMTTYEIDQWLKENDLYNTYGCYGRETKINKISERNN